MKEKSLSLAPSIKPYLGDKPAAVRAHKRRERQAWLTLADRHIRKTVRLEEPATPSPLALEKLNRRAHELHVRRNERIRKKYGTS